MPPRSAIEHALEADEANPRGGIKAPAFKFNTPLLVPVHAKTEIDDVPKTKNVKMADDGMQTDDVKKSDARVGGVVLINVTFLGFPSDRHPPKWAMGAAMGVANATMDEVCEEAGFDKEDISCVGPLHTMHEANEKVPDHLLKVSAIFTKTIDHINQKLQKQLQKLDTPPPKLVQAAGVDVVIINTKNAAAKKALKDLLPSGVMHSGLSRVITLQHDYMKVKESDPECWAKIPIFNVQPYHIMDTC